MVRPATRINTLKVTLVQTFDEVETGVRTGSFARSLAQLNASAREFRRVDPIRFDVIRAELLYNTSQVVAASELAVALLDSDQFLPPS